MPIATQNFFAVVPSTPVRQKRLKKKSALETFYVKLKTERSLIALEVVMAMAVAVAVVAVKSRRQQRFQVRDLSLLRLTSM
jgi:hypothetical protein